MAGTAATALKLRMLDHPAGWTTQEAGARVRWTAVRRPRFHRRTGFACLVGHASTCDWQGNDTRRLLLSADVVEGTAALATCQSHAEEQLY